MENKSILQYLGDNKNIEDTIDYKDKNMVNSGVIIFSVVILGLSVGVLCNMLSNKKWDDIIKLGEMEGFVGLKEDIS